MKRYLKLIFIICSFLISSTSIAKTAFIVDQLLVGLHQEKDINSPIIKVLSTGVEVDLMVREGDFAQVREKDEGKVGWVDASYLMYDKPARRLLTELQKKLKSLENQDSSKILLSEKTKHKEKTKALNNKIEDLKQDLSSEKLKAGELESIISKHEKKLAQLEAKMINSEENNEDKRVTKLEEEISSLQDKLKMATQKKSENVKPSTNQLPTMKTLDLFKKKAVLITLVLLALAGFFFGRYWEDMQTRKRHGGFRV